MVHDTGEVIAGGFDEAERRDPTHHRTWIALVDGNNHQIATIEAQAKSRNIDVTIVLDLCRPGNYADRCARVQENVV